jgi:drug/metabolite transporter (DMT)-like permease
LNPHVLLYGLITVMLLCWSGNYIAAKIVFREIPPLLVMCLRTMLAALLILPFYWRRSRGTKQRGTHEPWTRRELGILFVLGVLGMTLNQLFWTIGVARTTVVHSSMIMGTTPLWVLLMARAMGIEGITWPKVGGMAIAMTGLAMLQIFRPRQPGGGPASGPTMEGDFLVLLCALALAGMTAFGKRYKPRSGAITIIVIGYAASSILLAPVLWLSSRGFNYGAVTPAAWAGVFYMAAFSSITGYLIYYYVLARMSASRIATFQYLQPVFATIMAMAILGEDLTGSAVAAGGIIFTGVYVTERFG